MPRPYRIDPDVAVARAKIANRARHSPSTYIRSLARDAAKLTDEDRAALAKVLAASLAAKEAAA
jgi:hypothetical protein